MPGQIYPSTSRLSLPIQRSSPASNERLENSSSQAHTPHIIDPPASVTHPLRLDIERLEGIQIALYSGQSPEPGSYEFALGYVEHLTQQNESLDAGFAKDIQHLEKSRHRMTSLKEALSEALGAGEKKEAALLRGQAKTAYLDYLNATALVGEKIAAIDDLKTQISTDIAQALDVPVNHAATPLARSVAANAHTIMRYMSMDEARAIISTRTFSQGPRSFEQHKWFFTDKKAYDPKGGAGFDCELSINVPARAVDRIFAIASADPQASTASVRYKPGGADSIEQAETGAFGVHKWGLDTFSSLLKDDACWQIQNLKTKKPLPK